MFYRSTMLIITHVYFFPRRIVYAAQMCMEGNPCTACTHTEMCVLSHSFLFFSIACIFHVRLILFIFFPAWIYLSFSWPVCLSVSVCHCCCLMKFQYVLNHDAWSISRNTHIYTQQIHANCFDSCPGTVRFGCVVFLELNVLHSVCMCLCLYVCMLYAKRQSTHLLSAEYW